MGICYQARRRARGWHWVAWLVLVCGPVPLALATDLFRAGFETSDTPSYSAGQQLHQTGGGAYWNWSGDNIGVISSAALSRHSGDQGLDATRSSFVGSQIWWTRPGAPFATLSGGVAEFSAVVKTVDWAASGDSLLEIAGSSTGIDEAGANSTRSCWVTLNGLGELYAMNGESNQRVATGLNVADWVTIKIVVNLDARTYRVFVNENLVALDYNYFAAGVTTITSFQFKEYNSGRNYGGVYLDDVLVARPVNNPGEVFGAGFEATETPPYLNGDQIHTSGGSPYRWNWFGDDIATVSTVSVARFDGRQGLDARRRGFNGTRIWWTRPNNTFVPLTEGSYEIRAAVRAEGWADSPDSFLEFAGSSSTADAAGDNSTRSFWITLKGNQRLYALNGNSEQELQSGIHITSWNMIRVVVDIDAKTYDVYLNNTQVANDFAFYGPAVTSIASLKFKEYNNGLTTGGVYLDNVVITDVISPSGGAREMVVTGGPLDFGDRYTGQASTQTYTLSGTFLGNNITINAPSGFQVSTNNTTFSSSLTVVQNGGTVPATTVYVRFNPVAVQSYEGDIVHASSPLTSVSLAVSGAGLALPSPPVIQSPPYGSIASDSFVAEWLAVVDATNYLLDVSTGADFASFLPGHQSRTIGDVTSYAVSGAGGARLFYRVRAQGTGWTGGYSGVAGLVRLNIPVGYSMVGMPLVLANRSFADGGELAQIFSGLVDASQISVIGADGNWDIATRAGGQWVGGENVALQAGQGFYVFNNGGSAHTAVFAGELGNDARTTVTINPGASPSSGRWNILALSEGRTVSLASALVDEKFSGTLAGNWDEEVCDLVALKNPDGSWRRVMRAGNGTWLDLSTGQPPAVNVEPGTALLFYRYGNGPLSLEL